MPETERIEPQAAEDLGLVEVVGVSRGRGQGTDSLVRGSAGRVRRSGISPGCPVSGLQT